MVKVIKRDGSIVQFNEQKIENAIIKAMKFGSGRLDVSLAKKIARIITQLQMDELTIKDIEDLVYHFLCSFNHEDTAKAYEGYRVLREHQRKTNTSDLDIQTLVNGENTESLEANSNKAAKLISTMRDLISEEVSKDISLRHYLPTHLAQAHQDGIIYLHDLGHFITRSHNCMLVNLKDMLENGTVINGKMIEKPKSFRTACTIATQIIAQIASGQHGGQTISLSHLAPFVRISEHNIRQSICNEWDSYMFKYTHEMLQSATKKRLLKEISDGIQTLNYQINTLQTSNG